MCSAASYTVSAALVITIECLNADLVREYWDRKLAIIILRSNIFFHNGVFADLDR